jgi:hypothetical protein
VEAFAREYLTVTRGKGRPNAVQAAAMAAAELNPLLADRTQVFANRLYVPDSDSTLVVLPVEPGSLQGWNPSLAIVDELHVVTRAV